MSNVSDIADTGAHCTGSSNVRLLFNRMWHNGNAGVWVGSSACAVIEGNVISESVYTELSFMTTSEGI